jgi:tetratricopeptide (TPR) repeat protein
MGLRLVNALLMYWFIRGRIREGCDQVAKIAALPGSRDSPELLADALNGAGLLARDGNHDLADRMCSEALAISRMIGDSKREADALANLGFLSLQRGNLREAQEQFTGALAIYRALGAQQGMADATSFLALTAYYQQEFTEAQRLHEASLAIWIALNDLQGIVWARTRLASALLRQGDRNRALHELLSSLAIVEFLDFPWGYSWVFDGLADLAASQRLFSLAALLSAKASAVRASAGMLLPATEQADVDSVNRLIDEAVGREAREAALAAHAGYSIDQLVLAVSQTNPASLSHAFPAHIE